MLTKRGLCAVKVILVFVVLWELGNCIEYHLYGSTGNITSPGYPGGYLKDSEYVWKITVDRGQRIHLVIKDLDFAGTCEGCDCAVYVYDGFLGLLTELLNVYCTDHTTPNQPRVFVSTGRRMEIIFYSYYREQPGRGLWFYYKTYTPQYTTPTNRFTTVANIGTHMDMDGPSGITSDPKSNVVSTTLIIFVVVIVMIILFLSFGFGISKRLCRQPSPSTTPHAGQTQGDSTDDCYNSFGDSPPSYEEAMRNSSTNVSSTLQTTSDPFNSQSPSHQQTNMAMDLTDDAYDSTGLPSYAEAHRLSQSSLEIV